MALLVAVTVGLPLALVTWQVSAGVLPWAVASAVLALGVAASIAGYTVVDKHGLRYADPVPYLELVMVWPALIYAAWVARTDGVAALRAAAGRNALIAGCGMFLAYALVLAALERAP